MTKLPRVLAFCLLILLAAIGGQPAGTASAQDVVGSSLGTSARPPATKAQVPVPKPAKTSGDASKKRHKHETPVVHAPKSSHTQKPASKSAPAATGPASPPSAEATATPAAPEQPGKGSVTGLPLPRFVALRSEEVNLRTGPGTRYPIDWVYRRRDLPVQIEREFEVWRLISDPDGVKGWVHQATLTGRRSFIIRDSEQTLRAEPRDQADAVARLKPGVIGRLRSCAADAEWCDAQVGDYRGFIRRSQLWGVGPGEAVN